MTDVPPRFVRQFALTNGRARSTGENLPLDTIVTLTDRGQAVARMLVGEQARIATLCRQPVSIAEISAHINVHLGIARVLVSDMVVDEIVGVSTSDFDDHGPDLVTLERLLDDLQAL